VVIQLVNSGLLVVAVVLVIVMVVEAVVVHMLHLMLVQEKDHPIPIQETLEEVLLLIVDPQEVVVELDLDQEQEVVLVVLVLSSLHTLPK
jgi:hypothetical protein